MTSFFGRFKPGTSPANPQAATSPTKKDANAPERTPLEKLLQDAGPLRADGSDKFFGFENFGSTCYCNSIIQSLFYSVPFREQVINFPARSPPETLERLSQENALPKLITNVDAVANAPKQALSPVGRNSISSPGGIPRKSLTSPGIPPAGPKPEDNKDSPEYKKKMALAAGPVLAMNYENSKAYGMSESLFTCLKDIFEAIIAHKSRIGVVSPNKFLEILRRENEMFRTPMHQDAHEFLNLLLNEVVENVEQYSRNHKQIDDGSDQADSTGVTTPDRCSTAAGSNSGWVHELFEGTLTSETRCLTCENTSQRDEAFLDLSVDLEQHSSVTSCLRKFSEEEMLCERNKFHCDNCGGLQEAEKRMKIKRLPRILALHLKRFKYTEDLQRLQKLFHRVVYPYYLRLFNTTDDAEDPDRLYELYAVVVHIGGGPYHGHYVSIIKTQDRGWLLFDDEMVEPVDKAYVRNFFGGENVLACAYVLFYQETTEEAMQKEMEEEERQAAAGDAPADASTSASASEPINIPPKSHVNGILANGFHPLHHASTPSLDDEHTFANLNHAATAPPVIDPHAAAASSPPLDHAVTALPTLSPKKSSFHLSALKSPIGKSHSADKEKEKERHRAEKEAEKERKAAEKAARKEAENKRKEVSQLRRETYRKQEEELKAALEASRVSQLEDEKRRRASVKGEHAIRPPSAPKTADYQQLPELADPPKGRESHSRDKEKEQEKEKEKENGIHSLSKTHSISGLSRFRHSSMSLRHKPKFWGHKEKSGEEEHGGEHQHEEKEGKEGEKEKEKKGRFGGLGRKKSTFLH